jgi:hypothetical protein
MRMVTKTQSYDVYESAKYKTCKPLNELLEDASSKGEQYELGSEFGESSCINNGTALKKEMTYQVEEAEQDKGGTVEKLDEDQEE